MSVSSCPLHGKAIAPGMLASSISSMLALAGHSALFQAAAIIIGTFVLEDAATVAAAMQVQSGGLSPWVALSSLYAGIVLGDLGLYGLGRLSVRIPWVARQLPPHRQEMVRAWISGGSSRWCWSAGFCRGCGFRPIPPAASWVPTCAVHPGSGGRDRLLDQPAVYDFAEAGAIPDGSFGAWRWAGAAGFVAFIILAGRAAVAGLQGARR